MEDPLAASRLKCGEVLMAMEQGIELIPVALQPEHVARVTGTALEEILIDGADGLTAVAQPATDEIHHALHLLRMLPRIGPTENTPAGLPTDDNALVVDTRHGKDRARRGFAVAQRTIRPRNCERWLPGVALRAIECKALVVFAFRTAPAASRRHDDGPTALHEALCQLWEVSGLRKEARGSAASGRPVIEDQC